MVRLWNSTETNFKGNKWVLTECIKCQVTEELNGEFALDLEYPLQDSKGLSKYLLRGNIITCKVSDTRPEQQFRIRKVEKTSSRVVVYAQAKLIADLKENWCPSLTITGKTRKEAITQILNSCLDKHNYVVGSLDNNTNKNVILNTGAENPLTFIIGDDDNSIIKNYGGEFIINNNDIDIVDKRGENNNFIISYAKNISSIKETTDDTDLTTVLIPKSDDTYLPEYYVESPNVNKYEKRYFKEVDMNLNIWDGENEKSEGQITKDESYALMRKACNEMFTVDKVDQLAFNYSVDLITLRKTEEYKNYNILEKCNVGDIITVKHKLLNLDLQGRVNKTIYNVLLDKYNIVEIGFSKKDLIDIINTTIRQIQFSEQKILLQVNSLDNNLSAKIEVTAEKITSEVDDKINQTNSKIEQTASSITQTVTDLKNNTNSQIQQLSTEISTKVSDDEFNSEIRQLSNEISSKVSEDDFSSMITQNSKSVTVAIKDESDHNVVIDSSGLTVQNGAFVLEDSNGNLIMDVDRDGVIRANVIGVDDIVIHDTSKGSAFYNTLANMDEISTGEIKPSRLTLDYRDFYIGSDGYDLKEFVERIIDGKSV